MRFPTTPPEGTLKFVENEELKQILRKADGGEMPKDAVPPAQQFRLIHAQQVKAKDSKEEDALAFRFTISDGEPDRHKDTVAIKGWNFKYYKTNPVVLFGHDYHMPPVAVGQTGKEVWVESDKVLSIAEFPSREVYEFGNLIGRLVSKRILRTSSVGFRAEKWQWVTDEESDRKGGIDFLKQELLEWSVVPVPANPRALQKAVADGVELRTLKDWASNVLDAFEPAKAFWVPKETIEGVYRACDNGKTSILVPRSYTVELGVPEDEIIELEDDSADVDASTPKEGQPAGEDDTGDAIVLEVEQTDAETPGAAQADAEPSSAETDTKGEEPEVQPSGDNADDAAADNAGDEPKGEQAPEVEEPPAPSDSKKRTATWTCKADKSHRHATAEEAIECERMAGMERRAPNSRDGHDAKRADCLRSLGEDFLHGPDHEIASMENEFARRWNSDDPIELLAHHDNDGAVNFRGVTGALAILCGLNGEPQIEERQADAAFLHLMEHLAEDFPDSGCNIESRHYNQRILSTFADTFCFNEDTGRIETMTLELRALRDCTNAIAQCLAFFEENAELLSELPEPRFDHAVAAVSAMKDFMDNKDLENKTDASYATGKDELGNGASADEIILDLAENDEQGTAKDGEVEETFDINAEDIKEAARIAVAELTGKVLDPEL